MALTALQSSHLRLARDASANAARTADEWDVLPSDTDETTAVADRIRLQTSHLTACGWWTIVASFLTGADRSIALAIVALHRAGADDETTDGTAASTMTRLAYAASGSMGA